MVDQFALQEFGLERNPNSDDTDGDNLPDGWEAMFGGWPGMTSTYWTTFGPLYHSHMESDPDFTTWSDYVLMHHIVNPTSPVEDPDNDGFSNSCEYMFGTDPLVSNEPLLKPNTHFALILIVMAGMIVKKFGT